MKAEENKEVSDFDIEMAKRIISAKYSPDGGSWDRHHRSTIELQYEFREMIELSPQTINQAMTDLGFQIHFISNKPVWIVYGSMTTDLED